MLKHITQSFILAAASIAMMTAVPRSATAGGVIIDGRDNDTLAGCPADDSSDDASTANAAYRYEPNDEAETPLTEDEQEVFLFIALAYGGHEAAVSLAADSGLDPETTAQIIGDLDATDAQGGCAAVPVSSLAALAALALLRRRRR